MKLNLQLGLLALLGVTVALPAKSSSASASSALKPKSTSPGCGNHLAKGHSPGDSYRANMISDDGRNRSYLIHLPSNYTTHKPAPVVLAFHGRGKDSEYMEKLSQFSNEEFNPDAIAVYPQAIVNVRRPLHPSIQMDLEYRYQDERNNANMMTGLLARLLGPQRHLLHHPTNQPP